MLFVRQTPDDRAFHFVGPATYVSHQSETAMQITWRLAHPLPGDPFVGIGRWRGYRILSKKEVE